MRKGFAVNLKPHTKVNSSLSAFFSGNRCFLCALPCGGREAICFGCLSDLSLNINACLGCAKPHTASRTCSDCLGHPWVFIDNSWAMFQYHYPSTRLIQHMKFKQGIDIAYALGRALAGLSIYDRTPAPECIIPVPLHTSRLVARGYNQSVELARPLSKRLGIQLDTASCKRVRPTKPQSDMTAKQRKKNVRDAFSVFEGISYGHVLLVDDVITTGSTVNELARTLRLAGVNKVDVLVCARASKTY